MEHVRSKILISKIQIAHCNSRLVLFLESFNTWFPNHAFLYRELIEILKKEGYMKSRKDADMYPCSPFTGTSFNTGPYASTKAHRDVRNLAGGVCMVAVLGNFDCRTSGHFIMHEPKVVIEVAPGDVFFMPSSAITHSNSSLRDGEQRMSIVQYTSGFLFRALWQNFKSLPKDETKEDKEVREQYGKKRWKETWGLFPTTEEIRNGATTGNCVRRSYQESVKMGHSAIIPGIFYT